MCRGRWSIYLHIKRAVEVSYMKRMLVANTLYLIENYNPRTKTLDGRLGMGDIIIMPALMLMIYYPCDDNRKNERKRDRRACFSMLDLFSYLASCFSFSDFL